MHHVVTRLCSFLSSLRCVGIVRVDDGPAYSPVPTEPATGYGTQTSTIHPLSVLPLFINEHLHFKFKFIKILFILKKLLI